MKYEKSCGAILFRKENGGVKFLLLYRAPHDSFRASWDFPRGNMEGGETEEEVVRREIEEETGIKSIKFYDFRDSFEFFYKFGGGLIKKRVVYLLAETEEKEVRLSEEHQDYKWVNFEEAVDTLTHDTSKKSLRKAYEFLKKKSFLK